MAVVYVLYEAESYECSTTLGVFDSADVPESKILEYYGEGSVIIETQDVRDSGIEWVKKVKSRFGVSTLTLHSFVVGEI